MSYDTLKDQVAKLENQVSQLRDEVKAPQWWDKLQAIGPIAIAIVGAWFTYMQFVTSEKNQRAQATAQLQTARETSNTSLRAEMFKALVGQFFTGTNNFQNQVGLLTLFENNFQDFFSAGPLFEMIVEGNTNDVTEVIDLAKVIAGRQELLFSGTNAAPQVTLTNNQSVDTIAGDIWLRLTVDSIDVGKNRVHLTAQSQTNNPPGSPSFPAVHFWVNYFDMPLTDNTKVPGGPDVPGGYHRFAITLKGITGATNGTPSSAQLKIIEIEHDYLTSVDRPSLAGFARTFTDQATKYGGTLAWLKVGTIVFFVAIGIFVAFKNAMNCARRIVANIKAPKGRK